MKIGLMSDTHGHLDKKLLEVFSSVDEIWHAGDIGNIALAEELQKFKPLFAVYGNIDGGDLRKEFTEDLVLQRGGLKILMTHIGGYPGHYSPHARKLIETTKPDLFVCGHSHILRVMRDEKYSRMLCMNPGACGIEGFHKVKTVLRFEIEQGALKNLEAVELGKRGAL